MWEIGITSREGCVPPVKKKKQPPLLLWKLLVCLKTFQCLTVCSNQVNEVAKYASVHYLRPLLQVVFAHPSITDGRGMINIIAFEVYHVPKFYLLGFVYHYYTQNTSSCSVTARNCSHNQEK